MYYIRPWIDIALHTESESTSVCSCSWMLRSNLGSSICQWFWP